MVSSAEAAKPMGRQLHQKLGDDQRQYDAVTAAIGAARKEVIHDAAVLANHYRSLCAEIQKERAERQTARTEVKALAEDVQHLRSWLVTVFLTWGVFVAVLSAFLAAIMHQLTRSLWTAFLVWWNA